MKMGNQTIEFLFFNAPLYLPSLVPSPYVKMYKQIMHILYLTLSESGKCSERKSNISGSSSSWAIRKFFPSGTNSISGENQKHYIIVGLHQKQVQMWALFICSPYTTSLNKTAFICQEYWMFHLSTDTIYNYRI